jgi:hypothetical protein
MAANAQDRKKLTMERAARLHFVASIKTHVDEGGPDFSKDMLSSSTKDFQARLDAFVGDLKVHMTEFVEQTCGKMGSAKKG